ncbi:MAG: class I SAM-dependent methyltransferase [Betaproteobacteria bacterium]|nr:class I SAM-dependent methyltransferase [Betaproteobacteria bacterium]
MGIYESWILPWVIDLSMRNKEARRFRERVIPLARGRVLEIGIGSGLNLPFYSGAVEQLLGLEPSPQLVRMANRRGERMALPVEFLAASAENIPLDSRSVDTVVTTWTLCTIPDAGAALREMRRVLKPGGTLLFAEHGLAPDPGVQRWQHRLNPLWNRIGGGCNLNRRIDALIAEAGFRLDGLETEYAKGPKPLSFIYCGRANPA